jgi:hypothetical protein
MRDQLRDRHARIAPNRTYCWPSNFSFLNIVFGIPLQAIFGKIKDGRNGRLYQLRSVDQSRSPGPAAYRSWPKADGLSWSAGREEWLERDQERLWGRKSGSFRPRRIAAA